MSKEINPSAVDAKIPQEKKSEVPSPAMVDGRNVYVDRRYPVESK